MHTFFASSFLVEVFLPAGAVFAFLVAVVFGVAAFFTGAFLVAEVVFAVAVFFAGAGFVEAFFTAGLVVAALPFAFGFGLAGLAF